MTWPTCTIRMGTPPYSFVSFIGSFYPVPVGSLGGFEVGSGGATLLLGAGATLCAHSPFEQGFLFCFAEGKCGDLSWVGVWPSPRCPHWSALPGDGPGQWPTRP